MSDEEKKELTKKMYLEVKDIFKEKIDELKEYLQENFVCAKHCMLRTSATDKKFLYVYFGLFVVGMIAGADKLLPLLAKFIV